VDIDFYERMSVAELTTIASMLQGIINDKNKKTQSELRKKTQRVRDLEKLAEQLQHDAAA